MPQFSGPPQPGRNLRGQPVSTDEAAAPAGPYSQAITANGLLFLSGQRPVDPDSGAIPDGVEAQSHAVLRNVVSLLEKGGSGPERVVKVTAYLADLKYFDQFNAVYEQYFTPPYPARTTVGSQLRGILVELDAIAVCDIQPAEGDPR
ncbi:MAG: reactive intermediate/imine deaminase [Actinomycetia bacterium]|nr:reactive intermediate/imine deaminase [Actinomycetes bacterium]